MGQFFENINEIKTYISVSSNLDIRLLAPYEETAVRYVGKFIYPSLFAEIEAVHSQAYQLIKKAIANYMLPFAAPFLKVHISNTGINNYNDEKMTKSAWWDVRDYCLSAISIADNALSDAIAILLETDFKDKLTLTLFKRNSVFAKLFATPKEFETIYNIGNSWEVLLKLEPLFDYVLEVQLLSRLSKCTIEDIYRDERARELLRKALGFYTLAEALTSSGLTATSSKIVYQWEQLPWQKSAVLEDDSKEQMSAAFTKKGNDFFAMLIKYLQSDEGKFPCYSKEEPTGAREILKKKSGLYI